MKYRQLGKTNMMVSELGLGTAQLGGTSLIGGRQIGAPPISDNTAISILNLAFDSGINFFDSSDKYGDGHAERLLGKVFSKKRDKVFLATKCGITSDGNHCFDKTYVKKCLDESLRNIKSDYIDIFQLTKPDLVLIKSGYIYDLLDELKQSGKVRFSGISTGSDEETEQLISDSKVDSLQIFYNLLHVKPNQFILPKASALQMGIIIRSPLSSGLLSGRYTNRTRFAKEDDRYSFLYGNTLVERINLVNEIREEFNLTDKSGILHFSLNYLLSNSKISTVIPGVSRPEQLTELLRLRDVKRMSSDFIERIDNYVAKKCGKN